MVEPVDSDHHVAAPRLPHALDPADKRQVWPASREEHSTVTDPDHLSASHYGLIEELLSFSLHSPSLKEQLEDQIRSEDQIRGSVVVSGGDLRSKCSCLIF